MLVEVLLSPIAGGKVVATPESDVVIVELLVVATLVVVAMDVVVNGL